MPRVLVKTHGAHESLFQSPVFSLLELEHQAAIPVEKTGDIRKVCSRSTSHGIVLITSGPQVNRTIASEPFEALAINRPEGIQIPPLLAELSSWITPRSSNTLLRTKPFKNQRLQQIGDQPVLQRSEPSSRTTLIGEQPNPWNLLQLRDVVSRHRGAELRRRYGLLGGTSLFNYIV